MKIKNFYLNRLKCFIYYSLNPSRIKFYDEKCNLELANKIFLDSKINLKNIHVGLVKDCGMQPSYTKYERFLRNNNIMYDFFNMRSSSWIENVKNFDIIIWSPMSSPHELEEAREKLYFIEKNLNKLIYPSFDEIMFYENKILQHYILKNNGFPIIDTYISFDYDEVSEWIANAEYPFVSKIRTGSGSQGTMLVKNKKQARRLVEKTFRAGNPIYWPFLKQKNYVFFQKYIKNKGFDLRIIVVDENNILGYFRQVPTRDFRASGMGLIYYKELPKEAVKIAVDIINKLNILNLSIDFLQSFEDNKFYIIETSQFIRVDTDDECQINGVSGKYRYKYDTDSLIFEKGRYWLQELILKNFFEKHFSFK